jgi:hypothetical protein
VKQTQLGHQLLKETKQQLKQEQKVGIQKAYDK